MEKQEQMAIWFTLYRELLQQKLPKRLFTEVSRTAAPELRGKHVLWREFYFTVNLLNMGMN